MKRSHLSVLSVVLLAQATLASGRSAADPLAARPPMGWNSWNKFACNVSAKLLMETADAMATNGMREAGYEYLVVDDCWQEKARDAGGNVVPDRKTFPEGIKPVADYIHSKGLKFGLYTDAGRATCQKRAGSYQHEAQDANTYASWGVDYVKVDWCNSEGLDPRTQYARIRDAFNASGRDMVFSICDWGVDSPWLWGPETGQLWRTTDDIRDSWESMVGILDQTYVHAAAAGPGHWNDPDMLEVGNGGMTEPEYQAHFSLWAIMAAPLMAGNDLRAMSEPARKILLNAEVIAVDQDPAGMQGTKAKEREPGLEVWVKPLQEPGARAVALFNRTNADRVLAANWPDIGLAPGRASVRDLWRHEDVGDFERSYSTLVPRHGVTMLLVRGAEPPAPKGEAFLSDLTWTYAASAWGLPERDRSNGERDPLDGRSLSIRGHAYPKGVGVHAISELRVRLGGRCSRFVSDLGIDDEVKSKGEVVFEVWADGVRLFASGILTGSSPPTSIDLDVAEKQELRLRVLPGRDEKFDHADWAGAKLICIENP